MQIGNGCLKTTRFKQTLWDQKLHVLVLCLLEHLRETKRQYHGMWRKVKTTFSLGFSLESWLL